MRKSILKSWKSATGLSKNSANSRPSSTTPRSSTEQLPDTGKKHRPSVLGISTGALRGSPVALALPPGTFVDVHAVLSGDWADAARAPGLGRDLLEGMDFPSSPSFDVWLTNERNVFAFRDWLLPALLPNGDDMLLDRFTAA